MLYSSPSAFSRRAVVSYWRKYVHEVLVNRLGGLSLPRKSVVRLTDRPDMTLDVYRGRKTTIQPTNHMLYSMNIPCYRKFTKGLLYFQGPFVHIASIVATLLGKLSSFRGIYEVRVDCLYLSWYLTERDA